MKNKYTISRYAASAGLLLTACGSGATAPSNSVDNDRIHQQYHLWYDEGRGEISTYAQFRYAGHDGTTLSLNAPSYVYVNDNPMSESSGLNALPALNGTFYKKKFTVGDQYPKVVRFRYQNNDRIQINNEIALPEANPSVEKITRIERNASRPADLKISVGNVTTENLREVHCHLVKTDMSYSVSRIMDKTTRECVFNLADMEGFSGGAHQIQLRTTWQYDSVQRVGIADGRRYLTIISRTKEVEL
jgi:hypothetical protein